MKILVICKPKPGVNPATQIAPLADREMAALRRLREAALLTDAFSPGGPGAILFFDATLTAVESALETLPLVHEKLVETEIIELHHFPAF